jgi:hypothetical protein
MPKSNHYCPRYEGSKKGQKIALVCTSIRTLAPCPVHIFVCQGKLIKIFFDFFFKRQFHLQYLPMKKANYEVRSFLLQIWRFKNLEKVSQGPHGRWISISTSVCQRKLVKVFAIFFLQCILNLKYLSMKIACQNPSLLP